MGAGAPQPRRGRHRPADHRLMSSEYGVDRLLDELAADLRDGSYRPLAARRVFIPKPGSRERRPLSIPAVRDRVVQAAARIVLEPIFEADFLPCSFGFRPRKSAHDALQVLVDEAWRGRQWVVETDIANCFEAIPHDGLMAAIEERIVDRKLLKLVRGMLRAGVMEHGAVTQPNGRNSAGRRDLAAAGQRLPAPARPAMADARAPGYWSVTPMISWRCARTAGKPITPSRR